MKLNFLQLSKKRLQLTTLIFFVCFLCFSIFNLNLAADGNQRSNTKKDTSVILSLFKLQQNYPNPFNPTTQIKFTIPVDTHVKLTIFNMLGNEVAVLLNEEKPAGEYSVKFNASSLPSGVYLYRLQTDYLTSTKKLTLIK